jgi:hypothetical protein
MSTVHEIEQAIRALAPQDLAALRDWFVAFDAEIWDRRLEEDAAAGRLDRFADDHPSLHFKQVGRLWSVRVGLHYRALAAESDSEMVWFWIGTHAQYDRLLGGA